VTDDLHSPLIPNDLPAAPEHELPPGAPTPVQIRKKNNVPNPYVWGTGRRKTSVARVRVKPGEGKFLVNNREVKEYFPVEVHEATARKPLMVTDTARRFDVFVNVNGGGITGQAGAIALGLARALLGADASTEARLRDHKLLSRDSRKVERKKYGRAGARRRFQFSKR
jgi:small subunit ribosomal protein S9